jgi:hypothetical protein
MWFVLAAARLPSIAAVSPASMRRLRSFSPSTVAGIRESLVAVLGMRTMLAHYALLRKACAQISCNVRRSSHSFTFDLAH